MQDEFGIAPSSDEDKIAQQTIEATSSFESQPLSRLRWQDLDHEVLRRLIAAAENRNAGSLSAADLVSGASARGLAWRDQGTGETYATAAGIVLLAKDPSMVFPQCRILADAYRSTEPDGDPRDHEDIRTPMPLAIDRAIAFIDRNTRHPMRIVGLNRVRLDEYPIDGLDRVSGSEFRGQASLIRYLPGEGLLGRTKPTVPIAFPGGSWGIWQLWIWGVPEISLL